MGDKYVKISTDNQAFQQISCDLLGPYKAVSYPGARKPVKVFCLACGCQTYGAIQMQILGDASTKSILIGLLSLQTQFNKLGGISTDSGTQFFSAEPTGR